VRVGGFRDREELPAERGGRERYGIGMRGAKPKPAAAAAVLTAHHATPGFGFVFGLI